MSSTSVEARAAGSSTFAGVATRDDPVPAEGQVGDARQVERAADVGGLRIERRQAVVRGGQDGRAVLAQQQVLDGMIDGPERDRLEPLDADEATGRAWRSGRRRSRR